MSEPQEIAPLGLGVDWVWASLRGDALRAGTWECGALVAFHRCALETATAPGRGACAARMVLGLGLHFSYAEAEAGILAKVPRNLPRCRSLSPVLGPAVSAGSWRPHSEAPNLELLAGPLRNRCAPPAAARAPAAKTAQLAVGPAWASPGVLRPRVCEKSHRPQLLTKAGGGGCLAQGHSGASGSPC